MEKLSFGEKTVFLFPPRGELDRIIYIHASSRDSGILWENLCDNSALAVIDGVDWFSDLSPYPAPKTFRKGKDFTGGADDHLKLLSGEIVPAVEKITGTPASRAVAGYSLAGLFAVYALYKTDLFDRAASMSGSLWFDGFIDLMEKSAIKRVPDKMYFSLGNAEKDTRSLRMAQVESCTQRAYDIIRSYGGSVFFELNEGGHFNNVSERIIKGIKYIDA